MTTYVRYVPGNRVLDLSSLSAEDYRLITGLHGGIRNGDGVLICMRPGGGEMYIKHRADKYFAAHFPGGAHGDHPVALESPAHRHQKDYWARAAEVCGLQASTELPVRGGKLDVAITGGPVATDIEIQRNEIKVKIVKSRTTRYHKAGYLPVWFNDWGSRPKWLYEVPALGCNRMPWDEVMPEPRTVTATGLTVVEGAKCVAGAFERCPDGARRPCGRHHPKRSTWLGLTVDDVAGMIPAGQIRPLLARDRHVYLVSPDSFRRYQDMTGGLGEWLPGTGTPRTPTRGHSPEPCHNPWHDIATDPGTVLELVAHDRDTTQGVALEPPTALPRPRRPGSPRVSGNPVCPACGTARLTAGREICQSCSVVAKLYQSNPAN